MIPYLLSRSRSSFAESQFFERLKKFDFTGDIETGTDSRTVFSTDNSIYQLEPAGIIFPKDAKDLKIIATVMSESAFASLSITPRGGGTGTNGQSLTSGIVVDCSRHMNRILEIDPVRRIVRVEAGVVKDQLNRALEPYGLFFAPELSTSNRATIGGMVATDACGQGSCLYGKTSNHVLGLRIVLMDGTDWWSRPVDQKAMQDILRRQDRVGEIYRVAEEIAREKQVQIAEIFPRLDRYMTGYDLAHLQRPDGRFDLNALLCGSEGTLAMIAEVELNLLPLPAQAALINIRYGDFNTALEDARMLVALKVASVETVDEKILGLAKGDIVWNSIARFFPGNPQVSANGINLVEVLADNEAALEEKLRAVTAALDDSASARHHGYTVARGHADVGAIWAMRKRAVGLLGNVDGPVRPVAFVEDTAVPPENLAAYIREFRALLDAAGLSYGMFGHVDAGVLHVRPALDLTRKDHVPLVREISDAVVALTRKYGGVLWGEHGKGVRSEYVPMFFGDLYPCLQQIKRAFDPHNRLNPGKIAGPDSETLLKIDEVPLRGDTDRVIGNENRAAFDNAAYCNGNGACFDFDEKASMCPSYKATRDRRFSPKGRAALIREWLRLLAEKGVDPRREAETLRSARPLASLARRTFNSLNPKNRSDFSHEVRAAMDTCLACKACAGQCPVKVNVPAFRSKFLELYFGRYLRPLKGPLVGSIESSLPLIARIRPFYNLAVGTRPGQLLLRALGLAALPVLPKVSIKSAARRLGVATATLDLIDGLLPSQKQRAVIFLPDAFTAHFDPRVVIAVLELTRKMDLLPFLAPHHINGKSLHVHGYLGLFKKTATKTASVLHQLAECGIPLVGLDPSMTLTYRSEYSSIPAMRLKSPVLMPQEWLATNLHRLAGQKKNPEKTFRLLVHCTERSNCPSSASQWKSAFEAIGVTLQIADVGCCGMAGTFGHEARNRAISERLYVMSWQKEINYGENRRVVMATGYSCRSQVKVIERQEIPHPLQVINQLVTANGS